MPGLTKARELREERASTAERMKELLDRAESENRGLNAEEETEWTRLHDAQNDLLKRAERIEQHDALTSELAESRGVIAGRQDTDGEVEERTGANSNELATRAFDSYLRYGLNEMTTEERTWLGERRQTLRESRAQGTNVDTAGGYLVPEEFSNRIVEAMSFFGGMRQSRSTVLTTAGGGALNIPTGDDTSNTGRILGENPSSNNETDLTFGQATLNAYTYSSDFVRVSIELLQDSAVDVPAYVSRKLAERIGRITNTHFTTGDGASKPSGVVTGATLGVTGAAGQTETILTDDLVDLEHAVDISYRSNAQWMANDAMVKVMKKLKDGEGRPLWLPGISVQAPDSILGYGYIVNNDVAVPAASATSLLFGAFDNYYIRDVRGVTIRRLDERYAELHQVAFLAFSRHDGILVDAGQNPIQYYQHPGS